MFRMIYFHQNPDLRKISLKHYLNLIPVNNPYLISEAKLHKKNLKNAVL